MAFNERFYRDPASHHQRLTVVGYRGFLARLYSFRLPEGGDISWVDAVMEQAPAAIAVFDDKMRYLAVSRRFLSAAREAEQEEVGSAGDQESRASFC